MNNIPDLSSTKTSIIYWFHQHSYILSNGERTRQLARVSARKGQKSNVYSVRLNILWCSWALTSCFLISIVEVKVQSSPHTYRKKSIVNVPDNRRCECIHHLASRKTPCENISLAKLFKTKLTDSSFSLFLQHTWTTFKKFASVFIFLDTDDVDNTTFL